MKNKKKTILVSISSDIAENLARNVFYKHDIIGTYRNLNKKLIKLKSFQNIKLIKLDISDLKNIKIFFKKHKKDLSNWDNCIISSGTQFPVGKFENLNDNDLSKSIDINFKNQIIFIKKILPLRRKNQVNNIITWAGPATNNANMLYYPYTISKIALIKSMELLNYEISDVKFVILGPGWVKTKIHKETLKNKKIIGKNYSKTKKVLEGKLKIDTSMEEIQNCVKWVLSKSKNLVGGKNFSVKHDKWQKKTFNKLLKNNERFKLRRFI